MTWEERQRARDGRARKIARDKRRTTVQYRNVRRMEEER